jgi:hypothetical protein
MSVPWKCVSLSACLGHEPFFIPVVHSLLGAVGHVAASELPSQEGRTRSHGTRGSTGAHLSKEARSGAEGHMIALELTSARKRGPGPRDTWQHWSLPLQGGVDTWQHQSSPLKKAEPGAKRHMVASEPTSARRFGLKVQVMLQRVDARPATCLDLQLVCEGTRYSGNQQRPQIPPQERL